MRVIKWLPGNFISSPDNAFHCSTECLETPYKDKAWRGFKPRGMLRKNGGVDKITWSNRWIWCQFSNPAFDSQIWICSIWLFQENRSPWAQTLAVYWDVFGIHKGETCDWYGDLSRYSADHGFDWFDTFISYFLS